jgi:predicted DsbA family dithiol-disulfide isomerase
MKKMRVEVWSDLACPWCYVGKRRLETALERFPHGDDVEVVWRAFELDPGAPPQHDPSISHTERLARKYGVSVARARAMDEHLAGLARAEGLDFQYQRLRGGNTFDAHRLLHLAETRGIQGAVKERLLRAYFTEGEPIGDRETLIRLAAEAGLDAEEARAALASDAYAAEVRADEEEARELGIHGVPFFVIAGRYGISGAQPADLLLGALTEAWSEQEPAPTAEGAACGPDGCDPVPRT